MDKMPDHAWMAQAEVFRALGHHTRLRIIRYLEHGERGVSEIVEAVGGEQSNVSRHLALLKHANLVTSRKEGLRVFYRVCCPELTSAVVAVVAHLPCLIGGESGERCEGGMMDEVPRDAGLSDEAELIDEVYIE